MGSFLDKKGLTRLWAKLKTSMSEYMSENMPIATKTKVGGILARNTFYESDFSSFNGAQSINTSRCYPVLMPSSGKGCAFVQVTWQSYDSATTSKDGLMSAADKTKLNSIAENANNYTLPAASADELGGIKTGYTQSGKNYPIKTDDNGNAYVNVPWSDTNTTYGVVSTAANGLMPKLPMTDIVISGIKHTPGIQILTGDGKYKVFTLGYNPYEDQISLSLYDGSVGYGGVSATIPVADSLSNGLMSKDDKTKLNNIEDGANKYVLPTASNGVLGGIKTGYSQYQRYYPVKLDSNGNAYVNVPWENTTYNAVGTTGDPGLMTSADKVKLDGIDTTTLPFLIDLGSSSPFVQNTWLSLSPAIYAKLYSKTFTQPVYIRARIGNDNLVTPVVVDAGGNSIVYLTFFTALGDLYRLKITLSTTTSKATAVEMKTVAHSWQNA